MDDIHYFAPQTTVLRVAMRTRALPYVGDDVGTNGDTLISRCFLG